MSMCPSVCLSVPCLLTQHSDTHHFGTDSPANQPGTVPIQPAQCRFPRLAVSNAKKINIFFNQKYTDYGSNFIKQHS